MAVTRTHFTFRVDTWTPDRESIMEHEFSVSPCNQLLWGRNPVAE